MPNNVILVAMVGLIRAS